MHGQQLLLELSHACPDSGYPCRTTKHRKSSTPDAKLHPQNARLAAAVCAPSQRLVVAVARDEQEEDRLRLAVPGLVMKLFTPAYNPSRRRPSTVLISPPRRRSSADQEHAAGEAHAEAKKPTSAGTRSRPNSMMTKQADRKTSAMIRTLSLTPRPPPPHEEEHAGHHTDAQRGIRRPIGTAISTK